MSAPDVEDVAAGFTDVVSGTQRFAEFADEVGRYQLEHNRTYNRYSLAVGGDGFPYLPVAAYKASEVTTFPAAAAEVVFESSATGGVPSRHYVKHLDIYRRSVLEHFKLVFGEGPFVIAAHLPGYADRGRGSSLLTMMGILGEAVGSPASRSFLDDHYELDRAADEAARTGHQLVVFGAAFGLVDIVENGSRQLPTGSLVIETGGMKTHRLEITRSALHESLAAGFGVPGSAVYSEYGMCELLSQCYTRGGEVFYPPPWMSFDVVRADNPRESVSEGEAGVLAVFDLANVFSVSAVLTEDRAIKRQDGFEILGRVSGAELRGCNFLLADVLDL